MNFKNYLLSMFTETQTEVLRICLRDNSPVHIYGPQGSGKTMLAEGLRYIGFENISEPGNFAEDYTIGPDYIPLDIEDLTVLRTKGKPFEKPLPKDEPFKGREAEIIAWVSSKIS